MKSIAIFIFLWCIFIFTSHALAADQLPLNYSSLKNEYINNHPGQAIIPFPWETSSPVKILPFNYEIPAAPDNNFSMTACRDQFESGSFIISTRKSLSGINIIAADLFDSQGNIIPADAINVRTVKVWYQAADDSIYTGNNPGYYLTPELLLKDDSLVRVDYLTRTNYLNVSIRGVQQYIPISSPSSVFPSDAVFQDAPSLRPFSMNENENKQIWVTVHVPDTTPAGNYQGDIIISAPSETPVLIRFNLRVLPG